MVAAPTTLATAQLPATGLKTDVAPTSIGELRITPLDGPGFLLAWAGREIYVDPVEAADFQGTWPKADLILLTGAGSLSAGAGLHKPKTKVVAPGTIPRGGTRVFTLGNLGKPVHIALEAVPTTAPAREQGYVLRLGNTLIYISGPTPCEAGQLLQLKINIAFVALTTTPPITAPAAAVCASYLAPQEVYPYLTEGNAAQVFTAALHPAHNIDVRVRDWHPSVH
jgi:hypothetical protein